MNKYFCPRPWTHIDVTHSGAMRLCCDATNFIHHKGRVVSLETMTFEEIWNGQYYKDVRRKMADGEPVGVCKRCYEQEEASGQSPRTESLNNWLGNGWGMNARRLSSEQLIAESRAKDFEAEAPINVMLEIGTACNLRCRMCSGNYSSSIAADPIHSAWRPIRHGALSLAEGEQEIGAVKRAGVLYQRIFYPQEPDEIGPYFTAQNLAKIVLPPLIGLSQISVNACTTADIANWEISVCSEGKICVGPYPLSATGTVLALPAGLSEKPIEILMRQSGAQSVNGEPKPLKLRSVKLKTSDKGSRRSRWYTRGDRVAEQVVNNAPDLRVLVVIGGEPLLAKQTRQMLDSFIADGRSRSMVVIFSTNGTILDDGDLARFAQFRRVQIVISLDGVGKLNDYIRQDSDYAVIVKNIERMRGCANLTLIIGPTLQAYNLLSLGEILDAGHEFGASARCTLVESPAYLSVAALPKSIRRAALEKLRPRLSSPRSDSEASTLRRICQRLEKMDGIEFNPELFREFMTFTNDLDAARGLSFAEACPELYTALSSAGLEWDYNLHRHGAPATSVKLERSPFDLDRDGRPETDLPFNGGGTRRASGRRQIRSFLKPL